MTDYSYISQLVTVLLPNFIFVVLPVAVLFGLFWRILNSELK